MVTEERYRKYLARKRIKSIRKEEKEDFSILNEIAKMKGFRGRKLTRMVDKRRITIETEPIDEYVNYLATELGFRGKKKGERIEGKIIERDVSPYYEMKKYYAERDVNITYWDLIPEEDFIRVNEMLKEKWNAEHKKFIDFCNEFAKNIFQYYEKNKTTSAAITMDNMFKTLEEYHSTHPGSMNIYTVDDLVIGLHYCLPGKDIEPRMTPNKKNMIFELVGK